ncbi:MAG: DNA polymerase III subunit gamma/tau [Gemmatimonadales bacterium]
MSIALARRYRPRQFADLLVQDHVAAALRGAVARGRVGHGYLLTGPRGVGKTTAARILAMALNCEQRGAAGHPEGEPCGECASCQRIWNGSATLDVVEIDAASNRGVDDARDLRERAMYAASQEGHHKVYIIDEAHMLTREAWNALLKILEEPPPGVVFVFATTEPQKIFNAAAPVMSRLQRFDFRRISPAAIRARLRAVLDAEGLDAEDDALTIMARHADGGMRDALSTLDQCLSFGDGPVTAARVRDILGVVDDDTYAAVLTLVAERRPGDVFAIIDQLVDAGSDLADFAGGLGDVLRALVMVQYGAEPEGLSESTRTVIAEASKQLAPEDGVRMLKLLAESETAVRRSANPRLIVETLLLRWAMMDRTADLRALLAGEVAEHSAPATSAPIPQTARKPMASPATAPAAPSTPPSTNAAAPAVTVPQTTDGLRAVWSEVVDTASRQSSLLGQALDHSTPRIDAPGLVVLAFSGDSAVFQEGVVRQQSTVETILSSRMGTPTRIVVERTDHAGTARSGKGARLTSSDIRADRLTSLRKRDPALDAAADALDLELVDEG